MNKEFNELKKIKQVEQVMDDSEVNEKIANGWIILDIIPNNYQPNACYKAIYILGLYVEEEKQ